MDSTMMQGAYDQFWRQLYENGHHPLPIIPGTKKPGVFVNGEWREMVAWQDPNRRVIQTSQTGAGLSVRAGQQRGGAYLVALDWDNEDRTSEQAKDVFSKRYLEVRKQRNGISGVCTDFSMQDYSVTMKQESDSGVTEDVDVSTLVIEWEGGLRPIGGSDGADREKKAQPEEKSMAQKALDVLRELMATPENCVEHGEAPGGFAVRTERWFAAYGDAGHLKDNKNPEVRFRDLRKALRSANLIGEDKDMGVSWIALPLSTLD